MGFQNTEALFVPYSCLNLSKFLFLVTLPFSKQSAQVYIHSGFCKWRVYSNRSVFDLFPPLQFCRLTFPLYIFLPKVNSTHLALKEERCYFWPQVQTVSRARHESATARLTGRGSRNCPGPRSLEYSLFIWHLTSKSTARGKKIRSWLSAGEISFRCPISDAGNYNQLLYGDHDCEGPNPLLIAHPSK